VSQLVALLAFAFVGTVSPGPNNTVLWASGLRFGFRRTVPHVLGTALGIGLLVVAVAAGIGALFEVVPAAEVVLKVVGSLYLLYVAYLVLGSGGIGRTEVSDPLSIWQAIAFQWVIRRRGSSRSRRWGPSSRPGSRGSSGSSCSQGR